MPAASVAIQGRLDDLGTPLLDVEFVVLDLETTGGSPANDRITEVGAVKIRGGEVLGTFHTLVNPEVSIPPLISALTGITERDGGRRRADRGRAPLPARVPRRGRAGRPQRLLRPALRPGQPGAARLPAHRQPGRLHGPAGPQAAPPRRGAQRPPGHPGRLPRGDGRPLPPGPDRRPGDRRRVPQPAGAGRLLRRARPRGPDRVPLGQGRGQLQEGPPGRPAPPLPRGVPVPRRRRAGPVRGQGQGPPDPGAQLLLRRRAGQGRRPAARAGRHRPPAVRDRAGGQRPRGPADPAPPPPLQPPRPQPRALLLPQADP